MRLRAVAQALACCAQFAALAAPAAGDDLNAASPVDPAGRVGEPALAHVELAGRVGEPALAHVDLAVRVDPAAHSLRGRARIRIEAGTAIELALDHRFAADSFTIDGKPAPPPALQGTDSIWPIPPAPGGHRVQVRWHGGLTPLDVTLNERQALGQTTAASDGEGTFLPAAANWYPIPHGVRHTYQVSLDLPPGQRGLVPGELIEERDAPEGYHAGFSFHAPSEGIDLMAGPYRVAERELRMEDGEKSSGPAGGARIVRLRTYFHPRIADLSTPYLDAAEGYLRLYDRSIGRYPFAGFSVVSSPTPTGFGMPSLTYLGVEVLRLPFIRATSLGHEVLHNWWGNGVYADISRGNWAEGLTTFMADYAYRERAGPDAGRAARLEWLRDFAVLPASEDRPLSQFVSRSHESAQIVGYGKSAMVFFMLRDAIGPAAFDAGVRRLWEAYRFRTASWNDLRQVFEGTSGQSLDVFFTQWVQRAGAPQLRVECAEVSPGAPPERLRMTLAQGVPSYQLRVPVVIETDTGREQRRLDFVETEQSFQVTFAGRPRAVELDPDLRLFRRLDASEVPPIFRRVMVDPATRVVLLGATPAVREAARTLAAALLEQANFDDQAVPGAGASLIVIGLDSELNGWLEAHHLASMPEALRGKGDAAAWAVLLPAGGEVMAVGARDANALGALTRPLPHYGRRGFAVFQAGKLIDSGLSEMPPQRRIVAEQPCGLPEATPH